MVSLPGLLSKRARYITRNKSEENNFYLSESFINRLSLETELIGHKGCVNCLEWTHDGSLLASGSDDLTIRVWNPLRRRQLTEISSGHRSNIFSVKFLEDSNNSLIASAAADAQVRVHNVEKGEAVNTFNCHRYRVKRLCTSKVCPSLIWSAGEDGTVRVIDLRQPHTCSTGHCNNVCINLNGENISNGNQLSETKCLAVCPNKPYIAVGSSDQYVRLFDMRKLRLCDSDFISAYGSVGYTEPAAFYCVPGHISQENSGIKKGQTRMGFSSFRSISSTFVTFNENGSELLVNLGSEQIYLFDMETYKQSFRYSFPEMRYKFIERMKSNNRSAENNASGDSKPKGAKSDSTQNLISFKQYSRQTIEDWTTLKEKANEFFRSERYMEAVSCYSKLLQLTSYNAQIIYANRALALMRRKWSGDIYAALLDLKKAIDIDPMYNKAHIRLIKCMLDFEWVEEAYYWSLVLQQHVKSIKEDQTFIDLHKDLEGMREKKDYKGSERGISNFNPESGGLESSDSATSNRNLTQQERSYQCKAKDFKSRFCGHCNAATDIKEASFFGKGDGQYIVAGSDDGSFFIWDKYTTNLLRVMIGDESIVNCLQPNPRVCMLATSGIDDTIKLWSPGRTDMENPHLRTDLSSVASKNQKRLHQDPIETFFSLNFTTMTNRFTSSANSSDEEENGSNDEAMPDTCRTS